MIHSGTSWLLGDASRNDFSEALCEDAAYVIKGAAVLNKWFNMLVSKGSIFPPRLAWQLLDFIMRSKTQQCADRCTAD